MRPIKLNIENFGPYSGRAELDFSKLEDIFLITGKTGAGKTTIFDAICFALYGKVPGSRGDHLAKLYSDHAEEGSESFVSLEFAVGEKCYLAERTPRQERKKKKGSGTMTVEETLALYEISGGAKTNLVSKKSEGDAKLKEITGLEAEEFFKVVLLPQGEFAEFLKQNTSERQKVLGKLFPVENAVRVKELARKKAGDAAAQADAAAGILEDIGTRVSAESYPQAQAEAEAAVEGAARKSRSLEDEQALFVRLLSLRRGERDAASRLSESRSLLEEAVKAGLLISEKSAALSRSRAARPLEQYLRGMESANAALETAEAALAASGAEKGAAEKAFSTAESLNLQVPAAEKEALRLREKRPALVQMLEEEEKLIAAEGELRRLEARTEKLAASAQLLRQELAKQEGLIAETESLAAGQEALEEKMEASRAIKDIFMKFRTYRERMDELEKEKALTLNEINELERRSAAYEKNIPVLQAELLRLREEKNKREQADMAAHLSALLEPDKPCPVCGSAEHPCPASGGAQPFPFNERIGAQEAALLDAEKSRTALAARLDERKKERLKISDALAALETEIRETRLAAPQQAEILPFLEASAPLPPLPSKEIIGEVIKTESDKLNKIIESQKASREAAAQVKKLYLDKSTTQGNLNEAEKSLAAAGVEKQHLAGQIDEGREKHRILLAGAAGGADSGAIGGGAADALAALDFSLAEKESFIAACRQQREDALLRLSSAKAAFQWAEDNRSNSAGQLQAARAAFEAALSGTDFSSAEEAANALLQPDAEEKIEREIMNWRENRAALERQIAEQEKQASAIQGELITLFPSSSPSSKIPALEETEARLTALKQEREAAEEEKSRAFTALNSLEKDFQALQDAQKRYDELAARAGKFRRLSDDLSGKNPRKLPFDSWLLANYLQEAAAYATKRLEKMSDYRYSLLLDSGRQQGRGYAGLDLEVFDAHTGKTRPCATLSGGESFMASISLALGLADSIQNRSGGVKLDTIFIDEGFGSLDEASLDKALVILDELRERRMVGLISHVGEMRSRIPCRVEVVKTESGSRIEIP